MGRKKVHIYWTDEVDYGIKSYLSETDLEKKNRIYNKHLFVPFEKMCEIIINRWNWNYIPDDLQDLKQEMVSHMFSKLEKFNPNKGRSFSYFSLIGKNYLIQKNNKLYKETLKRRPMKRLYQHGYVDGHGSTGKKTNWQSVQSKLDMKDNFFTFINFLKRHGNQILESPYVEIVNPLVKYVDDFENTKYLNRKDYVNYIMENTSFDKFLLSNTTKRLRYLYRRFSKKIHSQKLMDSWIQCLKWKP